MQQLKSDYDNSRVVLWTIEIWNRTREAECSTSSSDPPFNTTTMVQYTVSSYFCHNNNTL